MGKFIKIISPYDSSISYAFDCPACNKMHIIYTYAGTINKYPEWTFNDDIDNPTVSPSIKCVIDYSNGLSEYIPEGFIKGINICHSFIRDGKIEYCGDSTHRLAGQTVDLPEFSSII